MGTKRRTAAGTAAMSAVALATLLGASPAAADECYRCEPGPGGGIGTVDPFWKFNLGDLPGGSDAVFSKHAPDTAFGKIDLVFDKHDELPANVGNVFDKFGG